jgi:hypothetical protein
MTDEDRAFIARSRMFFLATADADGNPDCSCKGGVPGFVRVVRDAVRCAGHPGAVFVVEVKAERIFPNCPRYIHCMQLVEESVYAPKPGHVPPVPAWKGFEVFRDALPERDKA